MDTVSSVFTKRRCTSDSSSPDFLATCRWSQSTATRDHDSLRIFDLILSGAEVFLPGTLPSDIEAEAPVLPKSWSRLYARCLDGTKTNSKQMVHLKILCANVTGRISRAHAIEQSLSSCDSVESAQCFVPTGHRIQTPASSRSPTTLSDIVRGAFCGMSVLGPCSQVARSSLNIDANILRCMAWDWWTEELHWPQGRVSIAARL